jgi:hypothetical protein
MKIKNKIKIIMNILINSVAILFFLWLIKILIIHLLKGG